MIIYTYDLMFSLCIICRECIKLKHIAEVVFVRLRVSSPQPHMSRVEPHLIDWGEEGRHCLFALVCITAAFFFLLHSFQ
jgi:hypothetical protein